MNTNEQEHTPQDIASAEDELRVAQETLEAAKARLAELKGEHPPVEPGLESSKTAGNEAVPSPDRTPEPSEVAVEATVADGADAQAAWNSLGEDARPAAQQQTQSEPVPDWTPYTTAPASAPSFDAQATAPVSGPACAPSAAAPAAGTVPPSYAAGYAQQPTQPQQPNGGYQVPGYGQTPHAGPGAVPPQQPYYGYQPYYQQPYTQPVVSSKDHVAAGLLAIFLGSLGIHKFYLGYNTSGFIMLAVTIIGSIVTFGLAAGVMWIISIIEGILYLTKSQSEFEQTYVINKREWF